MIRHKNRLTEPMGASPTKAGWRVNEWAADAGLSRSFVYILLADHQISSVKVGGKRLITTPPLAFIASRGHTP